MNRTNAPADRSAHADSREHSPPATSSRRAAVVGFGALAIGAVGLLTSTETAFAALTPAATARRDRRRRRTTNHTNHSKHTKHTNH